MSVVQVSTVCQMPWHVSSRSGRSLGSPTTVALRCPSSWKGTAITVFSLPFHLEITLASGILSLEHQSSMCTPFRRCAMCNGLFKEVAASCVERGMQFWKIRWLGSVLANFSSPRHSEFTTQTSQALPFAGLSLKAFPLFFAPSPGHFYKALKGSV